MKHHYANDIHEQVPTFASSIWLRRRRTSTNSSWRLADSSGSSVPSASWASSTASEDDSSSSGGGSSSSSDGCQGHTSTESGTALEPSQTLYNQRWRRGRFFRHSTLQHRRASASSRMRSLRGDSVNNVSGDASQEAHSQRRSSSRRLSRRCMKQLQAELARPDSAEVAAARAFFGVNRSRRRSYASLQRRTSGVKVRGQSVHNAFGSLAEEPDAASPHDRSAPRSPCRSRGQSMSILSPRTWCPLTPRSEVTRPSHPTTSCVARVSDGDACTTTVTTTTTTTAAATTTTTTTTITTTVRAPHSVPTAHSPPQPDTRRSDQSFSLLHRRRRCRRRSTRGVTASIDRQQRQSHQPLRVQARSSAIQRCKSADASIRCKLTSLPREALAPSHTLRSRSTTYDCVAPTKARRGRVVQAQPSIPCLKDWFRHNNAMSSTSPATVSRSHPHRRWKSMEAQQSYA